MKQPQVLSVRLVLEPVQEPEPVQELEPEPVQELVLELELVEHKLLRMVMLLGLTPHKC